MSSHAVESPTRHNDHRARWGVLIDLDGTLLDTEHLWIESALEVAESHGFGDAVSGESIEGLTARAIATHLNTTYLNMSGRNAPGIHRIQAEVEERVLSRFRRGVGWMPGAQALLAELWAHRIPTALVTSSSMRWVQRCAQSADLSGFAVLVTEDDVRNAKPHPDPYLRAADLLGLPPARCVVLEDSVVGVDSAVAAGCVVVRVGPARSSGQSTVTGVETLSDLSTARLRRLLDPVPDAGHPSPKG
ncbi:HAD family phosphatase [Okibacterium endophyticum]